MIYPPTNKASKLGEILPNLGEIVDKEHKRLLARKSIIEKRKEEHERQLIEMVSSMNRSSSSVFVTYDYFCLDLNEFTFCLCLPGTRRRI